MHSSPLLNTGTVYSQHDGARAQTGHTGKNADYTNYPANKIYTSQCKYIQICSLSFSAPSQSAILTVPSDGTVTTGLAEGAANTLCV